MRKGVVEQANFHDQGASDKVPMRRVMPMQLCFTLKGLEHSLVAATAKNGANIVGDRALEQRLDPSLPLYLVRTSSTLLFLRSLVSLLVSGCYRVCRCVCMCVLMCSALWCSAVPHRAQQV